MNQRHIGIVILVVAILIISFVLVSKSIEDSYIEQITIEKGSCFLDDGTCLHQQSASLYIVGFALAGALLLFGIYLTLFDRTQKIIAEHQVKVSGALEKAMKQEKDKDEFKAYLSGFDENEQIILKTVREQEGIKQSTLRYKTGISKTSLSLILKSLEKRKIISRKEKGKTKLVYLVKKF